MSEYNPELSSDYAWWNGALDGYFGPVHEGQPQCGYYRTKRADGYGPAVAIWRDGDKFVALEAVSMRDLDPAEIWTWVCRNPITHDQWLAYCEEARWPEAVSTPQIGHNLPPADRVEATFQALMDQYNAFWHGKGQTIASQEDADKLANFIAKFARLGKKADAEYEVEFRPHQDALDGIRHRWFPLIDKIAEQVKMSKLFLAPWIKAHGAVGTGKKVTLRKRKVYIISDLRLVAEHFAFKNDADLRKVCQTLVNKARKSGEVVPGVVDSEEEYAA
jgi:hypothetical protein